MDLENKIKYLFARNVINQLKKEEIQSIEDELYAKDSTIICFDAFHVNQNNDTSINYTWYIPQNSDIEVGEIDFGTILVVEQRVGIGYALVKAAGNVYTKTKEDHEFDLHPYCKALFIMPK